MLALLRFVENPRDRVAGFRILHLLPGIGPASAQRMLDRIAESADQIGALCALPSPCAGDDWKMFVQTVGNLPLLRVAGRPRTRRLWYELHLDRVHEDAEARRADLIQREQIAKGYPGV
jgi:DNA helicase-2/ATP-dependent DNA helicase PcrA